LKLDRIDAEGRDTIYEMLRNVEVLILDEADRLLGKSFGPEVEACIALLDKDKPPATWMFSATFPRALEPRVNGFLQKVGCDNNIQRVTCSSSDRLVWEDEKISNALQKKLERVQLQKQHSSSSSFRSDVSQIGPASTIQLRAIQLEKPKRTVALRKILQDNPQWDRVLVFCATRYSCEYIAKKLTRMGIKSAELHGKLDQDARLRRLRGFAGGTIRVLLATDVAGRGLDVVGLPAVINYDLPRSTADFVHRVGRTGRAGRKGTAISFVIPEMETHLQLIEQRHLQEPIPREVLMGLEPDMEQYQITVEASRMIPDTQHSKEGLAHDKMYGGIKGFRKSKKDKLREKAARRKAEQARLDEKRKQEKEEEGAKDEPLYLP